MPIRSAIKSQHQVDRELFLLLAHNVTRNLCKNAFKNQKFKLQLVQQFFESVFCVFLCFFKVMLRIIRGNKNSAYFVYKDCSKGVKSLLPLISVLPPISAHFAADEKLH